MAELIDSTLEAILAVMLTVAVCGLIYLTT